MMRFRGTLVLAAAFAVGGCGGSGPAQDLGVDGMMHDLATPIDMAGGQIGAACKATSDCIAGTMPVCFTKYFDNKTTNVQTPGGYCSSKCTQDSDCGSSGATCVDFGAEGKFCIAGCMQATDCRSPGYACFFNLGCFPNTNLNCDPTMNNGVCQFSSTKPGGCVRQAVGTGKTGQCYEQCAAGVDTCAPFIGFTRHCQIDDERTNITDGSSTGDKWVGPICLYDPTGIAPIADGQECLYNNNGMMVHYSDICVDGDECYLTGKAPAGMGFDSAGDNKCHQLCYLNNMTPSTPDGGFDFADGGVLANGSCPNAMTCTDIWGLASSPYPIGLCK